MTDEQLQALNERLDRFEARQERIAASLASCVDALEKVDACLVAIKEGVQALPIGFATNAATALVALIGAKAVKNAIARRPRG